MKRLLIDMRVVQPHHSGVGVYALKMLQALVACGELEIHALSATPDYLRTYADCTNVTIHTAPSHERHPMSELWMNTVLPRLIQRLEIDYYWGAAFLIPWCKTACKKIVAIHDLSVFTMRGEYPRKFALMMRNYIRLSVRSADAVTVLTGTVGTDLLAHGAKPASVFRIPCGVDENYSSQTEGLPSEWVLPEKFLLCIGAGNPRKNIELVEQALPLIGQSDLCLVTVGFYDDYAVESDGRVYRIPWLQQNQLAQLYRSAQMLVFPSLDEGFGMPVVEAFACGCPVLVSDIPVLREVSKGAAVVCDCRTAEVLAEKLRMVLEDSVQLAQLKAAGLEVAKQYTWQNAARQFCSMLNALDGANG